MQNMDNEPKLEENLDVQVSETSSDSSFDENSDSNFEETTHFNNPRPNKGKRSNLKYILSIVFLLGLIVATIIILAVKYDFRQVMDTIGSLNYFLLALAVLMIFIYVFFEGTAMKILLKTIDLNVGLWPNIEYSAIDYYFCAITPSATGGQPMVLYYMKKDGIPVAESTIILLMNTALFKIVLMILSVAAFIMFPGYVTSRPLLLGLYIFGLAFNFLIVFLCFLATFKRSTVEKLGMATIKLLHKMHIVKNYDLVVYLFKKKMDDYERAANLIKKNKFKFFLAFLANLVQRVAFFLVAYFVYLAFCEPYPEIKGFGLLNLMAIQVIIAISVDSLPFPGGVGISEFLFIYLYQFIYQTETLVGSAVMVTRALNFYIPVLVTMLIFIYKHVSNIVKAKKNKKGSVLK